MSACISRTWSTPSNFIKKTINILLTDSYCKGQHRWNCSYKDSFCSHWILVHKNFLPNQTGTHIGSSKGIIIQPLDYFLPLSLNFKYYSWLFQSLNQLMPFRIFTECQYFPQITFITVYKLCKKYSLVCNSIKMCSISIKYT